MTDYNRQEIKKTEIKEKKIPKSKKIKMNKYI